MNPDFSSSTSVLLRSLVEGPLLITDLPEAPVFPFKELIVPAERAEPLDPNQKLGHLFEDALALLLEASPRFELLARNLQLQRDVHTTLGELDFLLRDAQTEELIHLEVATKFYLAVPGEDGMTFPGPDARDNLARKLDRLRTHQLQLTRNHGALLPESLVGARAAGMEIETRQLIYGCLFDRIDAGERAMAPFLASDCRRGRWLTAAEVPEVFPETSRFEIIPKRLWPVPFCLLEGVELDPWSPDAEVERCVMLRADGFPEPLFVAPDGYPGHSSRRGMG